MTAEELARLRAKYASATGADVQDPEFRKVVDLLFTGDRRTKPYAGVSTFLDLPLRADAADLPDFGGLDVALVGVPMDLGVTNRAGSRLGPRAVRAVERIGPYHHVHRMVPMAEVKAADVGDVPFRSRYSLEQSHEDIEAFFGKVHWAGVTPVSVGGDHSMTLPILKAIGRDRPVGMVHIDAHADTGGPFEGSRFHHGGPFREAVLAGVLDPKRTIQIGIRGNAEYLWEFSYDSGMTVIHAEEFMRLGVDGALSRIRQVVGKGPVYISFDIDSLDPAFAPGTGTPEAGGLQTREAMELVRGCAGLDIVGGDVVEVAPMYDATTNTAQAGAQMLFEIFAVAALARVSRKGVA
jgi:agmatinase